MCSVSVVIPVYNAELCLENLSDQLMPVMKATTAQVEVIMVEDHGTDDSCRIIRKLASSNLRYLSGQLARQLKQQSSGFHLNQYAI